MTDSAQELAQKYHVDLYDRYPLTLTEGNGVYVKDSEGNDYLDALAGIAVKSLGHAHPGVVKAIREQAGHLTHISNNYYNEPQSQLTKKLAEISGLDKSFFCNSGSEAVERAIKLARKYGKVHNKKGKIIAMGNCFHGRTLGTIAMGKRKYREPFEPVPGGFSKVPFNDLEALEAQTTDETIAVIVETIQGEGGIYPARKEYIQKVCSLCDQHNILLICDEIQCGMARTGRWFCYQHYGITPDIVTSAKALANGFPIGAIMVKDKVADVAEYGEHGSTFGGNPLACAAALATIAAMQREDIPRQSDRKGSYFMDRLYEVAKKQDAIKGVRGKGLMIGVELHSDAEPVVNEMIKRGVLTSCTSGKVMRFVPPLIITREQIDTLVDVFIASLKAV
ncbi:aspartate aminotransferase family protein [Fodinibius salsisoli]|uniref:Acetylornithine aminotransferase n=1 Tax=Fodinibius salsisoli TaxID=2820877 RepID=A0ABT3PII7_9BACT|nr:aspartate aminotransferase family protein [Fodinibius salsisoli]MCW9705732.1 aspartate aminotransferase family protein [Fodinibius salsisoli]